MLVTLQAMLSRRHHAFIAPQPPLLSTVKQPPLAAVLSLPGSLHGSISLPQYKLEDFYAVDAKGGRLSEEENIHG